jgi:hypothetical protein
VIQVSGGYPTTPGLSKVYSTISVTITDSTEPLEEYCPKWMDELTEIKRLCTHPAAHGRPLGMVRMASPWRVKFNSSLCRLIYVKQTVSVEFSNSGFRLFRDPALRNISWCSSASVRFQLVHTRMKPPSLSLNDLLHAR